MNKEKTKKSHRKTTKPSLILNHDKVNESLLNFHEQLPSIKHHLEVIFFKFFYYNLFRQKLRFCLNESLK